MFYLLTEHKEFTDLFRSLIPTITVVTKSNFAKIQITDTVVYLRSAEDKPLDNLPAGRIINGWINKTNIGFTVAKPDSRTNERLLKLFKGAKVETTSKGKEVVRLTIAEDDSWEYQ